jgi:hypothetical protein
MGRAAERGGEREDAAVRERLQRRRPAAENVVNEIQRVGDVEQVVAAGVEAPLADRRRAAAEEEVEAEDGVADVDARIGIGVAAAEGRAVAAADLDRGRNRRRRGDEAGPDAQ